MLFFSKLISRNPLFIILITVLLIIPSFYLISVTHINYDLLSYLPDNVDSMRGQKLLDEVFKNSSSCYLIVENKEIFDILKLKDKIQRTSGVYKVLWIDDIINPSVPFDFLPTGIKSYFMNKNETLLLIQFNDSPSSTLTQSAVAKIKKELDSNCYLCGMTTIILDTTELSYKEETRYIIAAILAAIMFLSFSIESTIAPFLLLLSMGASIVLNMGTNFFFGEISYITNTLASVLQLGVTMDYSIFLYHCYEIQKKLYQDKKEAMAEAIRKTSKSIFGSAFTTVAGFASLCAMSLGFGMDMGLVMIKGVVLGVISTLTIFPSLLLLFDKLLDRFCHKVLIPDFSYIINFIIKRYSLLGAVFFILLFPAIYGERNVSVYYSMDKALPDTIDSVVALDKLKKDFNMTTTHMLIYKSDIEYQKIEDMQRKIEKIDGIQGIISYEKIIGGQIPNEFIPEGLREFFTKKDLSIAYINSIYKNGTDEINSQLDKISKTVKQYSKDILIGGEGALTFDLVKVADSDFKRVNLLSILLIGLIIAILFKSIAIPVILVAAIEFAIFINIGMSYYMNYTIPFIASVVIGCIQLGATVDYAILLTGTFFEELDSIKESKAAMQNALRKSLNSIVSSALTFFGATGAVYLVSSIDIIREICLLIARGAIVSMLVIIFLLPPILLIFLRLSNKTIKR